MKLWSALLLAILPVSAFASNVTNYFDGVVSSTSSGGGTSGTINAGTIGQGTYYSAATGLSPFTGLLTSGTSINFVYLNSTTIASDTQQVYQRCDSAGSCRLDGAQGARYFQGSNSSQMDRIVVSATLGFITPTSLFEVYPSGTMAAISTTSVYVTSTVGTVSGTFINGGSISGTLGTYSTVTSTVVNAGQVSATFVNATSLSIVGAPSSTTTGALIVKQQGNTLNNGITLEDPAGILARIYRSSTRLNISYGTRSNDIVIGSNGNVGIGGTTTTNELTVTGVGSFSTGLSSAGAVSFTALPTGTATSNLCITSAGGVVSTTTLSGCLGVSDPLVKKDIKHLSYGLAEVMQVDPIMYKDLREGTYAGEQVGLLAYDTTRNGHTYRGVESVMPELVDQNASTWKGQKIKAVVYERAIAVAFKAIQEQQEEIDELRADLGLQPKLKPWWKVW